MKPGLFLLLIFVSSFVKVQAQAPGRVGINTASPQETLHVSGTLRVDSVSEIQGAYSLAVFDSLGVLKSLSPDSLPQPVTGSTSNTLYWEEDSTVTTTAGNFTLRKSFTIPAGTHYISLYCEVRGGGNGYGNVILSLTDGINELCHGAPYCFHSQFCSWSCMKQVTLSVPTTFQLLWFSVSGGATSTMRVLRISAEER